MWVFRKNRLEILQFRIGDQILVGEYTATCQCVNRESAIFLMDYILEREEIMSNQPVDYDVSSLRNKLKNFQNDKIFDSLKPLMIPFENGDLLRIPMAEEIFGGCLSSEYFRIFNPRGKQWPLMMNRKNRIGHRQIDDWFVSFWLMNQTKDRTIAAYQGGVDEKGNPNILYKGSPHGVRIVFQLKNNF